MEQQEYSVELHKRDGKTKWYSSQCKACQGGQIRVLKASDKVPSEMDIQHLPVTCNTNLPFSNGLLVPSWWTPVPKSNKVMN